MRAKPFFIAFFAVVAVVAAVSLYVSATIDRTDKFVTAAAAPDGKYKAVRVTLAGGGATPFCVDSISVMPAAYPDHFAESNKAYEVYSGPCDTPANRVASPRIEWLSDLAVRITYSKPGEGKKLLTKDIDVTKSVHVTFVAH